MAKKRTHRRKQNCKRKTRTCRTRTCKRNYKKCQKGG